MVDFSPFPLNLQAVTDKITDSESAFLKARVQEARGVVHTGSGSETKGVDVECTLIYNVQGVFFFFLVLLMQEEK